MIAYIIPFPVLLDVATDNNKKAVNKFNKSKPGAKASRRGGSLLAVKGTATSGKGKVKEVWNKFDVQVVYCI